jgi:hypothetical protein
MLSFWRNSRIFTSKDMGMTQDERWQAKYKEVMDFM